MARNFEFSAHGVVELSAEAATRPRSKQILVQRNSFGTVALYRIGRSSYAIRRRFHGLNRTDRATFASDRVAFWAFARDAQALAYIRLASS